MIEISSTQNPRIKDLLLLKEKSKHRRKSGRFLIEGIRELNIAVNAGYQLDALYYCEALLTHTAQQTTENIAAEQLIKISASVFERVAYRGTTEGILAVAQSKSHSLADLKLEDNPLVLVAEAPEKPGNIGALLRTADAAGIDAVIIANPKTDLYNSNIIRSSVGCVFSNQIATGSTEEVILYLKQNGLAIRSAALQEANNYLTTDFTVPTAIVVGTEDEGLTQAWREAADSIIAIPMAGQIDSMNVSVAAAVLIFEAKRQRTL